MRRLSLLPVIALVLMCAATAAADTQPITNTPDLPWTNPAHTSNLEVLAGQIATHIAGRAVSIRCEGDTDWTTLVLQAGGDPNAELGYVAAFFSALTGQVRVLSTFAEIAGGKVCLPLKNFATATTKPTKCATTETRQVTAWTTVRVPVRTVVIVNGKKITRTVPTNKRRAYVKTIAADGPPGPCYLGIGVTPGRADKAYWEAYDSYAMALLTLAHESIHLGGVVGGVLADGTAVGDQQAEAKAQCYGMQWIPYVATQLGDAADDAQAIAQYVWDYDYPKYKGTSYWSADCRSGGPMDIRAPGSTAWP